VIRLFKQWRLNRVAVRLAGAQVALDSEYRIAKATGECYPIAIVRLRREVAELKERQAQLKENAK